MNMHWHQNILDQETGVLKYDFSFKSTYLLDDFVQTLSSLKLSDKDSCFNDFVNEFQGSDESKVAFTCSRDGLFQINVNTSKSRFANRTFIQLKSQNVISQNVLEGIVCSESFVTGQFYSKEYVSMSSNPKPSMYKHKGGIKLYHHKGFKMDLVDIENRPGRRRNLFAFHFVYGASRFWFGESFYALNGLTEQNIRSFNWEKIVEHDCDILECVLYEDTFDYLSDTSQKKQLQLMAYLDLESIPHLVKNSSERD